MLCRIGTVFRSPFCERLNYEIHEIHENGSNLGDRRGTRSHFVYFVYFVVKLYGMVVFVFFVFLVVDSSRPRERIHYFFFGDFFCCSISFFRVASVWYVGWVGDGMSISGASTMRMPVIVL